MPKDESKVAGGVARAKKLTPEQRSEIAKRAAESRWSPEIQDATHAGTLTLGDAEIQCYVLADGQRIISTRGVMKALGRTWRGRKYSGTDLPVFVEAKNLLPIITQADREVLVPVQFRTPTGGKGEGFKAEVLPTVCEIYLRANDTPGTLTPPQFVIAKQCELILRGIARVGIAALVDEATGYQEVRDKKALQAILDRYLAKELAAWAKRFPDEFYQQMFRLKGWPFNPLSVAKPGVVGKYTVDLIYERLAPGLVEQLEKANPKTESGTRKSRHHQWLSSDVGHPALAQHLHAVIGFMRACSSWEQFLGMLDRAFPKKGHTIPLLLE